MKNRFSIYLIVPVLAFLAACDQPKKEKSTSTPSSTPQAVASAAPVVSTPSVPPSDGAKLNAQERRKELEARLGMTPEQSQKVDELVKSQREEVRALRADASLTLDQRKAKAMEIKKNFDTGMMSILTPGQKVMWDAERKRMSERRAKRTDNGSDSAAPEQVASPSASPAK